MSRATRLALADHTAPDLLKQLADDEDADVRRAVASHPNTPQDVLLKLGKEFPDAIVANPIFNILLLEKPESLFIRLSLARSSTASGETLANLSTVPSLEVLGAIAQKPNTPISILEQLAQHPETTVRCHVAKNPNTPTSLLIELAEDSSFDVLSAVVKNPNTPADILYRFASWRNNEIHRAILQKPGVPATVLEKLAGEESWEIRSLVKAHPNASEMAIALAEFMEEKPGTPVHFLEMFAADSHPAVRRLVADHPHTPSHVLEALSLDADEDILLKVAEHPNASASTLERIAEWLIELCTSLLKNPKTPAKLLARLVDAQTEDVRYRAATHPNTSLESVATLATDPSGRVREGVLRRHDLTETVLETLIEATLAQTETQEGDWDDEDILDEIATETQEDDLDGEWILRGIAGHPKTPPHILEMLATNPPDSLHQRFRYVFDHIRRAIASNVNTPTAILEELAGNYRSQSTAISEELPGDYDESVIKAAKKTLKIKFKPN